MGDKEIEIGDGKKIHTFNPIVEEYSHVADAKNITSEKEEIKEAEVVK